MTISKGLNIVLFNLVIVGIIGCFLRYFFLYQVSGVNFGYVLHAHSHLAFLGWVFMALYLLLIHAYLPTEKFKSGKFLVLFVILQFANLGMLVTFPFMGYAFWSITFSAVHALAAMAFAWIFIREVGTTLPFQHKVSFTWVTWALILMFVSNLAPFALGPVSATQGKSDLYYLLIYFYLHFQYNGWFTFALMGLVLWLFEKRGLNIHRKILKFGFYLKLGGVFPAYFLSTLWTDPHPVWFILGGLAAIVQALGLIAVLSFLIKHSSLLYTPKYNFPKILFWVGVLAVSVQHVLMLLSAFPSLSELAFARNVVIAYLHLVLIGFVSIWLFYQFLQQRFILDNAVTKISLGLFLVAFVCTELVLVFQGEIENAALLFFGLAVVQLSGIVGVAFNVNNQYDDE